MRYTDSAGEVHELPKYTRSMARRFEQAQGENEADKRWRQELALVQDCLGAECAARILDGDTLDTVDVGALDAEFEAIASAYDQPRREAQAERIDEILGSLDVERLQAIAEAMDSLDKRQGFKSVK